MSDFPFKAGGTLLAGSPVYVMRKADTEAAAHLRRMEYITLVEPRQHGKTSLINWAIGQFSPQGYTFAYRDLMAAKSSADSQADWYASLGKWLSRQLRFIPRDQRPEPPTNTAMARTNPFQTPHRRCQAAHHRIQGRRRKLICGLIVVTASNTPARPWRRPSRAHNAAATATKTRVAICPRINARAWG